MILEQVMMLEAGGLGGDPVGTLVGQVCNSLRLAPVW